MDVKSLSADNINHVFLNLWQRDHNVTADLFIEMIGKPWTFAFYESDEPCAVGFMTPVGPMQWRTCFAATETGFKKIWLPLTLFFRRLSDQLATDGGYIEAYGGETYKEWFEAIGFTYSIDKYVKRGTMNHAIGHGPYKKGVLSYVRPASR